MASQTFIQSERNNKPFQACGLNCACADSKKKECCKKYKKKGVHCKKCPKL